MVEREIHRFVDRLRHPLRFSVTDTCCKFDELANKLLNDWELLRCPLIPIAAEPRELLVEYLVEGITTLFHTCVRNGYGELVIDPTDEAYNVAWRWYKEFMAEKMRVAAVRARELEATCQTTSENIRPREHSEQLLSTRRPHPPGFDPYDIFSSLRVL